MRADERRELLLRIIDLCETVSKRGLDPFDVEVKGFLDRLRELFPKLRGRDEIQLDIRALLGLVDVILHQGEWIKHRSSSLYLDPMLITWKLRALEPRELAEIFVSSWHPILELECISPHWIGEAMDYWMSLPSLEERRAGLDTVEVLTGEVARRELSRLGILSEEDFNTALDRTWRELKGAAGEDGEISYWDFICSESFEKTVSKAWLVSFLVSHGYAELELRPLEEEIVLKPLPEPRGPQEAVATSIPIPISREGWLSRWKEKISPS